MNKRPLGSTGMNVTEIGLGAWQLANPDWNLNDKQEALRIVQTSLDCGCNFFDTAPPYGYGRSEELLGQALKSVRPEIFICTKFGHSPEPVTNFDASLLRPSLEGSLRRLQTDYVDVLLMHNPPREMMDGNNVPHYEILERLKEEGKIRAYGVSLDWCEEIDLVIRTTGSQALEVFYNALYQEPRPAFQRAHAAGVGLIIKTPLDSGWLSGRYRQDSRFDDIRRRWPPEVIARRSDLVEKFAALVPPGISLTHAALLFTLADAGVSTTIPGPKNVEQTLDNFAAAEKELSPEVVQAMYELWEQEIQNDPMPW